MFMLLVFIVWGNLWVVVIEGWLLVLFFSMWYIGGNEFFWFVR